MITMLSMIMMLMGIDNACRSLTNYLGSLWTCRDLWQLCVTYLWSIGSEKRCVRQPVQLLPQIQGKHQQPCRMERSDLEIIVYMHNEQPTFRG